MQVIKNENRIVCDVDDTLILWDRHLPQSNKICIIDPNDNSNNFVTPHKKHIELLKKWKGRGYFIEIWSAAGFAWAEAVVKTLQLENHVDLITTKPRCFIDDLPANEVLVNRVYLKDE